MNDIIDICVLMTVLIPVDYVLLLGCGCGNVVTLNCLVSGVRVLWQCLDVVRLGAWVLGMNRPILKCWFFSDCACLMVVNRLVIGWQFLVRKFSLFVDLVVVISLGADILLVTGVMTTGICSLVSANTVCF